MLCCLESGEGIHDRRLTCMLQSFSFICKIKQKKWNCGIVENNLDDTNKSNIFALTTNID